MWDLSHMIALIELENILNEIATPASLAALENLRTARKEAAKAESPSVPYIDFNCASSMQELRKWEALSVFTDHMKAITQKRFDAANTTRINMAERDSRYDKK